MSKLVSIIMPTRSSQGGNIHKAIDSIKSTAGEGLSDVEILLRTDDDDTAHAEAVAKLIEGCGQVVTGPRGAGYNDMGVFVQELVKIADSKWSWLFDDDAWIEGSWYGHLRGMPLDCAVNAQSYALGPSLYSNGPRGGCVGLLIPTELARTIAPNYPVDQVWLDVALQRGWGVRQMNGCTYHHCGRARF